MNIAHHVLLLPNQSMWVLVPAMGGCDGLSGGGVSATFLLLEGPDDGIGDPGGPISDTPVVRAEFERAPSSYLLFLLVPAVSVVLGRPIRRREARTDQGGGHRRGSRVGRGLRGPGGVGLVAGLGVGSDLLARRGVPANASVLIGPAVGTAGLLALAWGGLGGALGGWLGGGEFPARALPLGALEPAHAVGRGNRAQVLARQG